MPESPSNFELRKVPGGWALISTRAPVVAETTPPAPGAPPLWLEILDSLVEDVETLDTLRDYGNVEPFGLALVGEKALLEALRSLLANGLIQVT